MKMTVQYMSDLAKWAEEHKDEIPPFLPVEEPGWIDQCKYRFPVAKSAAGCYGCGQYTA